MGITHMLQIETMPSTASVAATQYANAIRAMQKLAGQIIALGDHAIAEAGINGVGPGTLTALIAADMAETAGRLVVASVAAVAATRA